MRRRTPFAVAHYGLFSTAHHQPFQVIQNGWWRGVNAVDGLENLCTSDRTDLQPQLRRVLKIFPIVVHGGERLPEGLGTLGRYSRRSSEGPRHFVGKLGKLNQRSAVVTACELASGRNVGKVGMAGGARELDKR